jgi:hypothetical protein
MRTSSRRSARSTLYEPTSRLVEREIATGPSLPDPAHQIDGVRFGILAGDGDAAGEAENQDSD